MSGGNWTKVVYIAGKFRGKTAYDIEQNVRNAEDLALEVWRMGGVGLCPHANTRFFQGQLPDWVWLQGDLRLLERCDALLTVPGWRRSSGSVGEVKHAKQHSLPVFHCPEELRLWLEGVPLQAIAARMNARAALERDLEECEPDQPGRLATPVADAEQPAEAV